MRKLLLALLICILFIAGFFAFIVHKIYTVADGDISVSVHESEDVYRLHASYSRARTRYVQAYIDHQLHANHVFRKSHIDADMKFDDGLFIHVKNRPGLLDIKLDKTRNDSASCVRVKELAAGLKDILAGDGHY